MLSKNAQSIKFLKFNKRKLKISINFNENNFSFEINWNSKPEIKNLSKNSVKKIEKIFTLLRFFDCFSQLDAC